MGAQTSQPLMPAISHDPFPVNTGATQVCRTLGTHRTLAASGACPMPHVPVFAPVPRRDAVGRLCVEDGLGRLDAGLPECHVTTGRCGDFADIVYGAVFPHAGLLTESVEDGLLAFCVLTENVVMCVRRGSYARARAAWGSNATDTFPASVAALYGLSVQQLCEVRGRLFRSYKQHGVGVLAMDAGGFKFHVLVPNAQEYALHKAAYDGETRTPPCAVKTEPRSPSPPFTFAVPPSPPGRFILLDEDENEDDDAEAEWAGPPGSLPRVTSYALDVPTAPRKRRRFDAEVAALVRESKV